MSSASGHDWKINEVSTELIVTESVGPLGPEEVKKIVALVLQHVREERNRLAQHKRDTAITDRAYQSDVE